MLSHQEASCRRPQQALSPLLMLLLTLLLAAGPRGSAAWPAVKDTSIAAVMATSPSMAAAAAAAAATRDADAHCRVGLYMHDSADLFHSAVCPPKVNCRTARPSVPPEEILCMMEYLGSPRVIPNQDIPDITKNLFRFSCSSQAECGTSNEFCYRSSVAMAMAARLTSPYVSLASTADAAVLCA